MTGITLGYGAVMVALGLLGYFGTIASDGSAHPTALIPAGFGAIALALGFVATLGAAARKHAMHGAAMVGLLGTLMPLGRLIPAMAKGTFVATKPSTMALMAMAVLSAAFLALCVRSFIAARKARQAAPAGTAGM